MVNPIGPGFIGQGVIIAILAALGAEGAIKAIENADLSELPGAAGALGDFLKKEANIDIQGTIEVANFESDAIGTAIFDGLIDSILNVRAGATEADAGDAIKILERVLGYSAQLPIVFAQVGGIMRVIFGERSELWAESALAHLPEELGLNFFLGGVLERLFFTAVGTPLEESINIVHRPNRIDSSTVRRLLQQHKLTDGQADELLVKLGYPDDLIPIVKQLDQSFLTVSELQELFLFGLIDTGVIVDNLQKVGYDDASIMYLVAYITKKAQTQGGDFLRSVARSLVTQHFISIDQFSALLKQANVPDASIALEVEAIQLEDSTKRHSLTIGEIKAAYQSGILSQDAVIQDLSAFDYSMDDINVLLQTWQQEGKKGKSSIGENRILSYLLSGILTKEQATDLLVKQGVSITDAKFLVDHPSTIGSVYRYDISPATIISALKEDVITVDTAKDLLTKLSVSPEETNLMLEIAVKEINRKNQPKETAKKITVGEIEKAYKLGLIADSAMHDRLVKLGYTSTDADMLYAIWYTDKNGSTPPNWVVQT